MVYHANSIGEEGTLAHLKNILRKTDVNGNVKSNFKAHFNLLMLVLEKLVQRQAMEYAKDHPIQDNIMSATSETKTRVRNEFVGGMLTKFEYLEDVPSQPVDDQVLNYFNTVCIYGLHIKCLDDTAKEGDITRAIPNLKRCIPLFYAHSSLSKYMVEAVDYIVKVDHILSPLERLRVLEGSFVNVRGGRGNNVEADLVQEHSIRNQKDLIRQLGANKSVRAIQRTTGSAGTICHIVEEYDGCMDIPVTRSRHTKRISTEDEKVIDGAFTSVKPFSYTPGRKCAGITKCTKVSPTHSLIGLEEKLNDTIDKVLLGFIEHVEDEDFPEEGYEDGLQDI